MAAVLVSPCLGMFIGHQCWPSVIHHPSHLGPPFALSRWPHCSVIPVPAAWLGVLWWWSSLSLSSPSSRHLPYPIVVILALVAVPSLPLHGPLCHPPFRRLLTISSSSYSSSSSLLSVCFWGCDVVRGAYLVRGCWVVGHWSSIHCPPCKQGLAAVACAILTVTLL